jgi:UDP-N-acetylmuramate: L-alanyl-gamma-D-glutamyl-meso-diaminopimelate ligase
LLPFAKCPIVTYAIDRNADVTAANVRFSDGSMIFKIVEAGGAGEDFRSPIVGLHNLKNILAAYAMARRLGVTADEFRDGLASFQGIKRRQELRGEAAGVSVIDDFAHHPTAVRVTLEALSNQYPGRRIVVLFEPRTNTSRRNYFQKEYAESFDAAASVIVAPVYDPQAIPAELRFDPQLLITQLNSRGVASVLAENYDDVLEKALNVLHENDLAVLFSNGGFGGLHDRLLQRLREKDDL